MVDIRTNLGVRGWVVLRGILSLLRGSRDRTGPPTHKTCTQTLRLSPWPLDLNTSPQRKHAIYFFYKNPIYFWRRLSGAKDLTPDYMLRDYSWWCSGDHYRVLWIELDQLHARQVSYPLYSSPWIINLFRLQGYTQASPGCVCDQGLFQVVCLEKQVVQKPKQGFHRQREWMHSVSGSVTDFSFKLWGNTHKS